MVCRQIIHGVCARSCQSQLNFPKLTVSTTHIKHRRVSLPLHITHVSIHLHAHRRVLVDPDGTITDLTSGQRWGYLFWEALTTGARMSDGTGTGTGTVGGSSTGDMGSLGHNLSAWDGLPGSAGAAGWGPHVSSPDDSGLLNNCAGAVTTVTASGGVSSAGTYYPLGTVTVTDADSTETEAAAETEHLSESSSTVTVPNRPSSSSPFTSLLGPTPSDLPFPDFEPQHTFYVLGQDTQDFLHEALEVGGA